jgi:selenocysteine lyase/cysteine desulfurase
MSSLSSLPLVTVIGDPTQRLPVVSIAVSGVPAEQVVQRLADNAILAVGNPTSRVLNLLGVDEIGGVLTVGLAHYSTMAEVDHLVRTLASLG